MNTFDPECSCAACTALADVAWLRAAIHRMAACESIGTVRTIAYLALHGLNHDPSEWQPPSDADKGGNP